MQKNVAAQKWIVRAFGGSGHANPNDPITGDAANITANLRIDGGAANVVDDTNPTELEDGFYIFDLTQVETNGDLILISPESSTANVQVEGAPISVYTMGLTIGGVWDEVLTGGTHNINNSSGRRLRQLQEAGSYNGSVWLDTINGTSGTTPFENGADTLQVNNIADTLTLLTSLGLSRVQVAPQSIVTLGASVAGIVFVGTNWTLDLNGQDISGAVFIGAIVTGTGVASSIARFETCEMGNVTLPPCRINGATGFAGTITFSTAGNYDIIGSTSLVPGAPTPTIDLGAAVGATNLNVRDWHGGITFNNIQAGDVITLEGVGGLVTVNGTGGVLHIRGIFEEPVDNSSAAVAITQTATLNRESSGAYADGVWVNTNSSNTGVLPYTDGIADQPAGSIADAFTIATLVGVAEFMVIPGSALVLEEDSSFKIFRGAQYSVALNGQDIEGTQFHVAQSITGIGISGSGVSPPAFFTCAIGTVTLPVCNGFECGFFGTFTIGTDGGTYTFGASAKVFGASPSIDFGAGNNASMFALPNWAGGDIEIQNTGVGIGTYGFEMAGNGALVINANCEATTEVILAGNIAVTNNGTGITIDDEANYNETQSGAVVNSEVVDVIFSDMFALSGQVAMPLTPTLVEAIMFLYKAMRNKSTQTATQFKLFADDGTTVDQKATVSDDNITAIKGEIGVGP